MKPYVSLLRVRFLNGIQYRASFFWGLANQFFFAVMLVFIYGAFYAGAENSGGFSYRDLVTYVWLMQAFIPLIWLFDWDNELLDMITKGGIGYELCRPVSVYKLWYVKLLSRRLAECALCFAPTLIIGFLMPRPYNLSLPQSPAAFLFFVAALALGAILLVSISMMIYISIFKTMHSGGSILLLGMVGGFFAGAVIPIPLMPEWLQNVCDFLPFKWTTDFPLRVYSGSVGINDAAFGILVQILWIIVLMLIGSLIMKRVTRLSCVQGG